VLPTTAGVIGLGRGPRRRHGSNAGHTAHVLLANAIRWRSSSSSGPSGGSNCSGKPRHNAPGSGGMSAKKSRSLRYSGGIGTTTPDIQHPPAAQRAHPSSPCRRQGGVSGQRVMGVPRPAERAAVAADNGHATDGHRDDCPATTTNRHAQAEAEAEAASLRACACFSFRLNPAPPWLRARAHG
jgi:hypothetical protein